MNSIRKGQVSLDWVRRENHTDIYCVAEPIHYSNALGETQTIPAGFETDGASIPRCLWWLFGSPLESHYMLAAVVHDYHCVQAWKEGNYYRRVVADSLFRYLLSCHKVSYLHAASMYAAVRWWGWVSYCLRVNDK